jgi:transcription antitermination factor NusB
MKPRPSGSGLKRQAREMVVKTLYEIEMGGLTGEEARKRLLTKLRDVETRNFAIRLLDGVLAHTAEADKLIAEVAETWDLSRMAAIDRNVLRLGTVELVFMEGVPEKVAINEAIEIAKRFSTENSGRFVNGILDKVARMKREVRGDIRHTR